MMRGSLCSPAIATGIRAQGSGTATYLKGGNRGTSEHHAAGYQLPKTSARQPRKGTVMRHRSLRTPLLALIAVIALGGFFAPGLSAQESTPTAGGPITSIELAPG